MTISVAGAPVSFGVFEMTPEGAETLAPEEMLAILAEAGYDGVDLGPIGYLGRGRVLSDRLAAHGLSLAGGWIEMPFTDDDAFASALPVLDDALSAFADAAAAGSTPPKPTLADHGSPARKRAPGRGWATDPIADAAFGRLIANTVVAAERVRAAGFEPTFHHHAGTFVESPEEIDRFLDAVDIGLTLDTGHLLIGGGDPVALLERWGSRVNHLHLKDVDIAALRHVLATGGGMTEVWSSGAFVAFGDGDIDLAAVMTAVTRGGYDGWLVVEQDVLNGPDISLAEFRASRAADQIRNRDVLRRWC